MITDFRIFESNVNEIEHFVNGLVLKPSRGFIYVTPDITYANAYASGMKSSAHMGVMDLEDGVIFVVWLSDEWESHWGGDVWKSGFEGDVIDDLKTFRDGGGLSDLLRDMFESAGIEGDELEEDGSRLDSMIKKPVENLLQLISPWEWCGLQERYQGYSEVALKRVDWDKIIEVRVYKDGELVKEIEGGYKGEVDWEWDIRNIFYHGSPLGLWGKRLGV